MSRNLKNVSRAKRELISQIAEVWHKHRQSDNKDDFISEMKDIGWCNNQLHGDGSFKKIVWKGSIVGKFAPFSGDANTIEVEREWEQYTTAPSELKKYFPICYSFKNGLLIQDRVILGCHQVERCNLSDIVREFGLADAGHNHGHTLGGTVKFFDWVWNRRPAWLENIDRPLKEKTA